MSNTKRQPSTHDGQDRRKGIVASLKPLDHKAVRILFLLLIIALACLPYSGLSGSWKLNQHVYEWQLSHGKLLVSSYPAGPPQGKYIIIEKSARMLYFYNNGRLNKRYPIATGKDPTFTPEGRFEIVQKAILIPDGQGSPPEASSDHNPQLGSRWLGLGVPHQADKRDLDPDPRAPQGIKYGIHGTNDPSSIGKHISGGCIRMHNHHVVELYGEVDLGTVVEIRP